MRPASEQRDRRETRHRVVLQLLDRRREDRVRVHEHQQRVTVRRRLGREFGAEQSRRARSVLDHHRLTEGLGQRLCHRARHHVGDAARRMGHDDPYRLGGPGLRRGGARTQQRHTGRKRRGENVQPFHAISSVVSRRAACDPGRHAFDVTHSDSGTGCTLRACLTYQLFSAGISIPHCACTPATDGTRRTQAVPPRRRNGQLFARRRVDGHHATGGEQADRRSWSANWRLGCSSARGAARTSRTRAGCWCRARRH